MARKKKHPEHANHERWLVSYADFITLLFAFFVVLYSSSQVDKRKVGKLALAIQVAFQQMGAFPTSNTKLPLSESEPMPFQDVQVIENVSRSQDLQRFVQPGTGSLSNAVLPGQIRGIQEEIEKALAPEIGRHVVEIKQQREGLVISLREMGFFESGSATMQRSSADAIDRLVGVLRDRPEMLRIEGHTDNVPIHNAHFQSNWELSTARAMELLRIFIMDYKFAPERLTVSGYGEYHPVDTNDTPEGRGHNRRVDIVVLAVPVMKAKAVEPKPLVSENAPSAPETEEPVAPKTEPQPAPAK
jgi:chemotaxis protein MotB